MVDFFCFFLLRDFDFGEVVAAKGNSFDVTPSFTVEIFFAAVLSVRLRFLPITHAASLRSRAARHTHTQDISLLDSIQMPPFSAISQRQAKPGCEGLSEFIEPEHIPGCIIPWPDPRLKPRYAIVMRTAVLTTVLLLYDARFDPKLEAADYDNRHTLSPSPSSGPA